MSVQPPHSSSPEPSLQDDYHNDSGKNDSEDVAGKIFIGGLSWQTTESTLRYYFEKFGELADVALMMDKRTGKPRGFGFIKMKDPAAADVVMANEHTIDGRLVDVKRALPRDKAPGPARSEACKIFVGGLSSEVTEKEFGDYFSKYGVVKDAVVMVDRNTGSSRGFGFITFEKEETVEKVLSIEHEIKGKYVEIKRAEPREATRPGGQYDGGMYGGMGGASRGGGRSGGSRYSGSSGGRGGNSPMSDGYGGGAPGGYGGSAPAVGYMGGRGGAMGGYGRYPSGYGGVPFRGGAPYAMAGMPAGYGYAAPAASAGAMGGPAMGYYGGAMPANGGYAAYGAAPGAGPAGAPTSIPAGYGGASYGGAAPQVRTGAEGSYGGASPPGEFHHHGVAAGGDGSGKGYDSSAIAGYANAAMQMRAAQQQPYGAYGGASPVPGYGGTYGYQGHVMANPIARNGPAGPDGSQAGASAGGYGGAEGGYGAYRGQGAAQGRADRSYRPY